MQAYGRELKEAADWCRKYQSSRKDSDLHQAWDLYYHVFKQINKQLPSLTVLELQYVAPALVRAQVCSICGCHNDDEALSVDLAVPTVTRFALQCMQACDRRTASVQRFQPDRTLQFVFCRAWNWRSQART